MKTHKSAATANGQDGSSMPGNKNRKNNHLHHKSPLAGALTPASPLSSTSHSSLSSTSCSLPSPFLPSQSLFWSRLVLDAEPDQKTKQNNINLHYIPKSASIYRSSKLYPFYCEWSQLGLNQFHTQKFRDDDDETGSAFFSSGSTLTHTQTVILFWCIPLLVWLSPFSYSAWSCW